MPQSRMAQTVRMANRELPVQMVLKVQTASRRTSAAMATGISARPTPASHRAGQLALKVMQVQPALLARSARKALPVRPAKMAVMRP